MAIGAEEGYFLRVAGLTVLDFPLTPADARRGMLTSADVR